jgi:hypothetical protein
MSVSMKLFSTMILTVILHGAGISVSQAQLQPTTSVNVTAALNSGGNTNVNRAILRRVTLVGGAVQQLAEEFLQPRSRLAQQAG